MLSRTSLLRPVSPENLMSVLSKKAEYASIRGLVPFWITWDFLGVVMLGWNLAPGITKYFSIDNKYFLHICDIDTDRLSPECSDLATASVCREDTS